MPQLIWIYDIIELTSVTAPPIFFSIGRIKVLFATQHLRILHVGQTVWLHSETKNDVTGSCSVIFARPFDFGLLSGRLFLGNFPSLHVLDGFF